MAAAPMVMIERDASSAAGNPYAGYGIPIWGAGFIGRYDEIRSLRSRVFDSLESASAAIVGPPRVGKSSLAQQVMNEFAVGTSARGLTFVPLWLTVSGLDDEQSLFRELAYETLTWLERSGFNTTDLVPLHDALAATTSWGDMRLRLRPFLREVRRQGYQIVVVLDEFDGARNVFQRPAPFELLRTIAYEPSTRVALLTTSRRELSDIVVQSGPDLSTFAQIFGRETPLGCFSTAELTTLIEWSPHSNPSFTAALREWLTRETGGQPFLATALLAALHEILPADAPPAVAALDELMTRASRACASLTVRHHEQLLELLREENRLMLLLEVLFGPQVTARPLDAERFERDGIIRATDDGWVAFSKNFEQYLALLERSGDDWPLWQNTEVGLRTALADALQSAYGAIWPLKVRETNLRIVQECEERRRSSRRSYGELAPDNNFLEYAYPGQLLAIMMMHWEQVAVVFGRTKDEWSERLDVLIQVRTPMAHNRSGPDAALMVKFRAYCQEILAWLQAAGHAEVAR